MSQQIHWHHTAQHSNAYESQLSGTVEIACRPGLEQELQLRMGPLRQQWEARGPGMLRQLAETHHLQLPACVDVHVVFPVRGGGGAVGENAVYIEGVLANPEPTIPEIVRLAWLISRLELPTEMPPQRKMQATIRAVLLAAEHVELVRYSAATIGTALAAWHVSDDSQLAAQLYSS